MKTITKLMALSALMLGGSLAVNAQPMIQLHDNPAAQSIATARIADAQNYDVRESKGVKFYTPKRSQPKQAEGETVQVKIGFDYDDSRFYVDGVQLIGENAEYFLYSEDSITSVVPGYYDIFVNFAEDTYTYPTGEVANYLYHFAVREQVDFTTDGAEVRISPDDTMDPVTFKVLNPDGEPLQQSTYRVLDTGNELINQGNIAEMYYENKIINKETGRTIGWGGNLSCIWVHDDVTYRYDAKNAFWISPLSDRYALASTRVYYTQEGDAFYHVYLQGDYSPNGVITNDASKYAFYEENFHQTPYGQETKPEAPFEFISMNGFKMDGSKSGGWELYFNRALAEGETMKYYINNMVDGEMYFYPLFRGGFVDAASYDDFWEEYSYKFYVYGPYVTQDENGVPTYVNSGDILYRRIAGDNGSYAWDQVYPGNPVYSYQPENKNYTLGNCCPISLPEFDTEWGYLTMNKLYGRAGEQFQTSNRLSSFTVKVNGEVVNEYQGRQYINYTPSSYPEDEMEIIVTNNNVDVDGLAGQNTVTLYFDNKNEDVTPPTVTMLDFVNSEGIMTDRFENAEDATLRFYAGDFNAAYTEEDDWYYELTDALASVEVMYSPYMEEIWEPIEVIENPDMFYLPALGQYFSGSLANVQNVGSTGWCDLKIRLTDAAGNWQEQVISPSFHVNAASTSITEVETATDATVIGYYDLQGRQLSAPVKGINIVLKSDGTASKMIVK